MKRTLLLVSILLLVLAATLAVMRSRAARGGGPPAILSFAASAPEIRDGESVTITWETQGVPSVALEWGSGLRPRDTMQKQVGLPPSGSMILQPREDTIYVLECETAPAPLCTSSVSVRVK